jgi:putative inorganic carbon (hco3(-)) transporter
MNQPGNGRMIRRTPTASNHQNGAKPSESALAASLYRIRVKEIWKFVLKQKLSFWFICLYLFMEYVRPQQIYPEIDVLPWAQIFIIGSFLFLLFEGKKFRPWQLADTGYAVFIAAILVSIPFAYRPAFSMPELYVPISWAVIYFLITNIIDNEPRFLVFMLSFMLHSFKMAQHGTRSFVEGGGGFRTWGATGAPGWFTNSGEFAIQMCIFFAVSLTFFLALRKHLGAIKQLIFLGFPGTAVISVVASSSRGGQLALGAGIGWFLMKSLTTKHKGKAIGAALILAIFAILLVPAEQWTRFSEMGEDKTSTLRITYWKAGLAIMSKYPVFGIGYDNWLGYYMANVSRDVQVPHNIFIEAGAELGYTGLLAFVIVIIISFVTNYRTRKLAQRLPGGGTFISSMAHGLDAALVSYLVAGFFVTVLHYPFFWINLAFTASLYNTARNELRLAAQNDGVIGKKAPVQRISGRRAPVPQRIGRGR